MPTFDFRSIFCVDTLVKVIIYIFSLDNIDVLPLANSLKTRSISRDPIPILVKREFCEVSVLSE